MARMSSSSILNRPIHEFPRGERNRIDEPAVVAPLLSPASLIIVQAPEKTYHQRSARTILVPKEVANMTTLGKPKMKAESMYSY